MLIDDAHGGLGLGCKVDTLGHQFTALRQDGFPVAVHIGLAFLRGVKEQVKGGILILEVQLHHFLAVVDFLSLGILHGEGVVQVVLDCGGIVGRIRILLIQDGLDLRILGGVNLQAAAVEHVAGLSPGVALDVHQVIDHLIRQFVLEIAVDPVPGGRCGILGLLDPGVDVIL